MTIRGRVDAQWVARVSLPVQDANGQFHPIETVIDTGYDGGLTLPPDTIRLLRLTPSIPITVTLATGTRERLNTWRGQVLWHNRRRAVRVVESPGDCLLGMELLEGSQLVIQVRVNGAVLIEEMDEYPTPE